MVKDGGIDMTVDAEAFLEQLPSLLKAHPDVRARIHIILSETFVTRDELTRALDELTASRLEIQARFDAMDDRFDAMDRRFEEHREETSNRFDAMDRRFEEHREETSNRFDAADRRFEEHREETDNRFDAVDKRFDAVDKRFDAVDKRFDAMDRRFDEIDGTLADMHDWVGVTVGGFQNRAGKGMEAAVAGTLRIALKLRDLDADSIRMRQKIEDRDGLIGPAGRTYEYDIMVHNGQTCVFEVKSVPDAEDVERFADKCRLVEKHLDAGPVRKVIVTLAKSPEVKTRCEELGVTLA